MGAELFYAEGHAARQADIYKEAVTFHNFAYAPNTLECFNCLGRMIRNDARCASEIKSTIAMTKSSVQQEDSFCH